MMKFCVIGDPHGDLKKIRKVPKNVDFYLITGDLGSVDLARKIAFENIERRKEGLPELEVDIKTEKKIYNEVHFSTLGILKYLSKTAPVYSIEGNVPLTRSVEAKSIEKKFGFKTPATWEIISENKEICIVKNVIRNLGGVRVGFLEHFREFDSVKDFWGGDKKEIRRAVKPEEDKARRTLKRFGHVDILICHMPPYGFLDKISKEYGAPKRMWGKHVGSKIVLDYIKKFKPDYVFCGHVHEGEGHAKIGKSEVFNLGVGGICVIEG